MGDAGPSRLLDYFFVGGLGPESIGGTDERSVKLNEPRYVQLPHSCVTWTFNAGAIIPATHSLNPIEHVYLGEILARYPLTDHPGTPMNAGNILSFCFPDRVSLRAAYTVPHFHTFALTNELGYVVASVGLHGPRIHILIRGVDD